MKVKLPRQCSGQEILEALRQATALESTQNQGSVAEDVNRVYEYEPGSVKQVLTGLGLRIKFWFTTFTKRFVFWGKLRPERLYEATRLVLCPLTLDKNYDEIDFKIIGTCTILRRSLAPHSHEEEVNADHVAYKFIKGQFEKILERFYALLTPAATQ